MDKLLLRGDQLKAVARRYSVCEDALGRHKKHMQLVIAKAAAMVDQKELAYGSALLGVFQNAAIASPVAFYPRLVFALVDDFGILACLKSQMCAEGDESLSSAAPLFQ